MRIAILGAGISGLATSFYLQRACPSAEIRVFEKSRRVGGVIDTMTHDGNLYELGARGLRPAGKGRYILDFIHDIGLMEDVVVANHRAKGRWFYLDGQMRRVPQGTVSAVTTRMGRSFVRALLRDLWTRPATSSDESVGDFASRHFGHQLKEDLFRPMITGICAGDIDRISARALFPQLVALDGGHGSFIKGWMKGAKRPKLARNGVARHVAQASIISFKHGMTQMVECVAKHVGGALTLDRPLQRITKVGEGYRLEFANGTAYDADIVVSTLPSHALVNVMHGFDRQLVATMDAIEYAPVAVVPMAFRSKINRYKGFGYLLPQNGGGDILGAYWNEQTFPELSQGSGSSMTVLLGGTEYKDFDSKDKEHFMQQATARIQCHLKITEEPFYRSCKIIQRAIPQCAVGHVDRMATMQKRAPKHFHISGNFVSGAGIADIIRHAQQVSQRIAHD